ncbi:MAG: hypothetical protein CR986_00530 [Ignavibacteriae bacterium]|nr:MAG: hypothetical protein CR986_00530 [Ignavibacteriota bacterium]
MNNLDVVIIGAGPIGLACGIEAKKKKLNHLIIEKGCLVNSIYNYPTNMVFFSTSERLEIGDVPFISHGVKPTRSEALEYYRRVKDSWELNVKTYEKVIDIVKSENIFLIKTNHNEYKSKHVIIATGFYDYPNLMNIPGEDLDKVFHYYVEPHPFAYQKVLVIGGGNSAVDVALETYRRGAEVTLVLRKDSLENNVKYWVKPDIENRINEGEIKLYKNSTVKEIKEKEVIIETPQGEKRIDNDFVLAMTGYKPDFTFLKKVGIEFQDDSAITPVYNSESYETNVPNLFLAGVICGGMNTQSWFIENARVHAPKIFKKIKK